MTTPPRHRSFSQLYSYTRCGMAFLLERVEKKRSPPSTWSIKGSALHNTLEDWEKSERAVGVRDAYDSHWDAVVKRYETEFPDVTQWVKTPSVKSVSRDLELRKAQGLAEVERYVEMATLQSSQWKPLRLPSGEPAVELYFEIDFSPVSPLVLRGYIDLLIQWADGTVTVRDYKSGSDEHEDYRQLGLYAYAAGITYNQPVTWGEYYYTKLGRSSGWKELSRYDHYYLLDQYRQLDQGIEAGIFLPSPSKKKCGTCGVRQSCPEMKDR